MTKLDLDLINRPGYGLPVSKELDRQMVKYVVRERMIAIEGNRNLLQTEPWDHSDVFYAVRTHLNRQGYDTSVYNDNVSGGMDRRKKLYDMIKDVCENDYHVKRHEIGIYPEDRAVMAFNGRFYSVGFDNLRSLMNNGTDVIVVEKQGTVVKMVPFTKGIGIAFIQSQGFVSEYGVALARLCNQQDEAAYYTSDNNGNYWLPQYKGHLGVLTDCDSSGVMIGLKIRNATRIGIDLETIRELNDTNPGLGLRIEDLQEGVKLMFNHKSGRNEPNTHWKSLKGLLDKNGQLYDGLSEQEALYYQSYLTEYNDITGGNIQFIDWLKTNRIELNTILAAAKTQAFWNWLRAKLLDLWPDRDYRRAIRIDDSMLTPTMTDFISFLKGKTKPVVANGVKEARDELSNVHGFYDDINIKREEIETDIMDNILLPNEKIRKLDLALREIMKKEEYHSSSD